MVAKPLPLFRMLEKKTAEKNLQSRGHQDEGEDLNPETTIQESDSYMDSDDDPEEYYWNKPESSQAVTVTGLKTVDGS